MSIAALSVPNRIRLPRSLSEVTTVGEEAAPEDDIGAAAVERIWTAVQALYRSRMYPGIALALRHRGRLLLERTIGHARGNGPGERRKGDRRLLRPNTPVCLFSASKAITAMLVHRLAQDGVIDLDAPVAEYIPEFAQGGKQFITVGDVLAHRAGIPSIRQRRPDPSLLWDWDRCIEVLCAARPRRDAGTVQAYHAVTGGFILGEVMRRATGEQLNELIDRLVRKPLGARYLRYGLAPEDQPDAAWNYFTGWPEPWPLNLVVKRALGGSFRMVCEVSNSREFMSAVIPAGNVYATAREACDFFQCLLDGGRFGAQRLFSRATVARAVREASPRQFDRTLLVPLRASEGFMLGDEPFGLYGPHTGEAFGHLGFINIFCWADPARGIAVSLLTTGKPLLGPHIPPLVRLLATINRVFPKEG